MNPGIRGGALGPLAGGLALTAVALALVLAACGKAPRAQAEGQTPEVNPPGSAPPVKKNVFDSPLAGRWYPGDAAALRAQLDAFMAAADVAPLASVQALVLPHAGYRYSGAVAAYGLKALGGAAYERVVVLGPSHRVPLRNRCSVPQGVTHYATPLGETELDTAFIDALLGHPEFVYERSAHDGEHSVQIELPLLQYALGEFHFVPIVVGRLDAEAARRIAAILRGFIGPNTLVVASTDFTHYGPSFDYVPFRDNIPERLEALDMGAWDAMAQRDADALSAYIDDTGATICGRCPLAVLAHMLPEASEAHLLKYDTSGRLTGDWSNSVSYLSAAFTGSWPKGEAAEMTHDTPGLTDEEKRALLELARRTLTYHFEHGRLPKPADLGIAITPGMEQVMGAFVTLHEDGRLRGCIGEIVPRRPLYQAVMDHALNAALRDTRFPAVAAKEIPRLEFEISALTPPQPVDSYDDIVIGKHGMTLEKHGRRAVFLPQVAPEQGWDLATTLTHLAMKAGLSRDAWREGAHFQVFEAIVFHEGE